MTSWNFSVLIGSVGSTVHMGNEGGSSNGRSLIGCSSHQQHGHDTMRLGPPVILVIKLTVLGGPIHNFAPPPLLGGDGLPVSHLDQGIGAGRNARLDTTVPPFNPGGMEFGILDLAIFMDAAANY